MDDKDVAAIILAAVNKQWEETKRPVPLTQLAATVRDQVDLRQFLQGRKLLKFVQDLHEPGINVRHHPNNELIWFVFPSSVSYDEGFAPVLEMEGKKSSDPIHRYVKPFWTAFVKPPMPGTVRALRTAPDIEFRNFQNASEIPEGWIEIGAEFINTDPAFADPRKISESIDNWLTAKELSRDLFIDNEKPVGEASRIGGQGGDVGRFFKGLSELPAAMQARVLIPLDVVMEALKR